jgi:peptide deformylase
MALLKIAQVGHPVLRTPTREVTPEELASVEVQTFIDDMIETMRDANGAGLAANQVYVSKKICIMEVGDNPRYPYKPKIPLTVLVNPVITPLGSETFSNFEGCLSVPNLRGRVERSAHIRVDALDREGQPFQIETKGITAGTYQHEVDHLDMKLFLDRVSDPSSFCTWAEFQRYHEATFRAEVAEIVKKWGS